MKSDSDAENSVSLLPLRSSTDVFEDIETNELKSVLNLHGQQESYSEAKKLCCIWNSKLFYKKHLVRTKAHVASCVEKNLILLPECYLPVA